jgi:hypothetical protein
MRNDGVMDALTELLASDPAVADRAEVGWMITRTNQVLGWAQAAHVALARRLHELEAAGESEPVSTALMDEGRRSGKEAKATEQREQICAEFPSLEDALVVGDCSADHLDALARLTKGLTDVERSDLHLEADEIVESATSDWVSEFERKTKNIIDRIKENHSPGNDEAELERQRAASKMTRWVEKSTGMCKTMIELDPIRDAMFHSAHQAQLARLRSEPGNDGVTFAQLQIDALIAATSSDTPAQRRPEVTVHVDLATVCSGRHADTLCELTDGTPVPVSTAQRFCCDATVVVATVDENGEVLNVGREYRTANRAQRRALRAMYRSCAHPHCTVSFDHCRIHHIRFWINGGTGDLHNLIPLCERHHHLVHEGRWTLTMDGDRVCTWLRPDGTGFHRGPSINRRRPQSHRGSLTPPASSERSESVADTDAGHQPMLC